MDKTKEKDKVLEAILQCWNNTADKIKEYQSQKQPEETEHMKLHKEVFYGVESEENKYNGYRCGLCGGKDGENPSCVNCGGYVGRGRPEKQPEGEQTATGSQLDIETDILIRKWNQNERKKRDIIARDTLDNGYKLHYVNQPEKQEEWREWVKKKFNKLLKEYKNYIKSYPFQNPPPLELTADYGWFLDEVSEKVSQLLSERTRDAKQEVLERVALETRANVCECGEKWSETDLGIWVEKELSKLLKEEE